MTFALVAICVGLILSLVWSCMRAAFREIDALIESDPEPDD